MDHLLIRVTDVIDLFLVINTIFIVSVGGGRSGESLMDELTATINRRKNLVEPKADEVVENGTSSKPSTGIECVII
jgi:hypothetical protein